VFAYADTIRARGTDVIVVVETVAEEEVESSVKGTVEVELDQRVRPVIDDDVRESVRDDVPDNVIVDGAVEVTYETLGGLVQSEAESDPSEDPSSGHIPPLPAVSPFLSSDDDTTDNDTPDTPPSPTMAHLSSRLPLLPEITYHTSSSSYDSSTWTAYSSWSTLAMRHSFEHSSSDSSSRYSLSDHSSPDLPSTFAGPSCKRRRSPMTSVPTLVLVSRALSPVRVDLIPSPKRVMDIGYLAYVEGHRIVGDESAVAALTKRVAELERDKRRLRGIASVESQRVDRLQHGMSRMQKEMRIPNLLGGGNRSTRIRDRAPRMGEATESDEVTKCESDRVFDEELTENLMMSNLSQHLKYSIRLGTIRSTNKNRLLGKTR
nr:hypothetical protein [Tanacetum cinerariifolium]